MNDRFTRDLFIILILLIFPMFLIEVLKIDRWIYKEMELRKDEREVFI